jgi:small subunit ribosomal protein S3Ae
MATKKTSAIPNWKKKKWYEIIAPPSFSEKILGETNVESPSQLLGKVISVNMMNVIGSARKQNFRMKFVVTEVADNKGKTKPIVIEMLNSSIRRLIKAGKERIDVSFTARSKDGILLRFKPLIVTKDKASNSVLADIQKRLKEFITEFSSGQEYESIFVSVAQSALQKELKVALDKVYPVKLVEIRVIEVEKNKGKRL